MAGERWLRGGTLLGMRKNWPVIALVPIFILLAGCITHLPLRTQDHLRMRWAPSFEAAVAEAQRTGKPILACLIAGQIDGLC